MSELEKADESSSCVFDHNDDNDDDDDDNDLDGMTTQINLWRRARLNKNALIGYINRTHATHWQMTFPLDFAEGSVPGSLPRVHCPGILQHSTLVLIPSVY